MSFHVPADVMRRRAERLDEVEPYRIHENPSRFGSDARYDWSEDISDAWEEEDPLKSKGLEPHECIAFWDDNAEWDRGDPVLHISSGYVYSPRLVAIRIDNGSDPRAYTREGALELLGQEAMGRIENDRRDTLNDPCAA